MDLFLAGLAGVLVGALVASLIFLHLLQKKADRDLVERRLSACFDYRECLGGLETVFESANGDARAVEQAWHQVGAFCREFRRTGWLFRPEARLRLEALVGDLERERRTRTESVEDAGGRAAQILCEKWSEIDRLLRDEAEVQVREHRKQRFLPGNGTGEAG